MGLKVGFDATLTINGSKIVTIGDINYESSRTEIEVKNRASEFVRYQAGMRSDSITLTVQAGTDPDDPQSVDGYDLLKNAYESKSTIQVVYTSPGGFSITRNQIVTAFNPSDPVDDLSTASVTLRNSASDLSSSSSGSV